MAECSNSLGYQCEFVDSVFDIFYCKKCSLVARRLIFTSCCGESYCQACIADIQKQGKTCPKCGQHNFTTMMPLKHQRQMDCLKVYCSMKGGGCSWSGMLGQLDTHLDTEQNHCQYVDIKCPLHCHQTIPRNKVEQHVAKNCSKRDYVCQYCDFKATYEVVVDTHWPQCVYFPLQCPNFCGMTCERGAMGDHTKACSLQEVACEFSDVGGDGRSNREDQEEHASQNNQKHLCMTASSALRMNLLLQKKLLEQEEKLQQQEQTFKTMCKEQERKFEKKFHEHEQKFYKLLQERDQKFTELQAKFEKNGVVVKEVANFSLNFSLKRNFSMENFSKEKAKDKPQIWKSPAMYTHAYGYKFCIGIDANGDGYARGKAMTVYLRVMHGEYDHQLKWPAQISFTIELLNQHGGENVKGTLSKVKCVKPGTSYEYIYTFGRIQYGIYRAFLQHSKLKDFFDNDALYFQITNIAVY